MVAHQFIEWCREKGPTVIRDSLLFAIVFCLVLTFLPLIAIGLFVARGVLLLLLVPALIVGAVACAVSPRFRQWLH